MADSPSKSAQAFRTISEVAAELRVPQHILRYWETRFPQLKPLQRAGNRRYYRPEDVELARRIHRLLDQEGYTIRGVQQVLAGKKAEAEKLADVEAFESAPHSRSAELPINEESNGVPAEKLRSLRNFLKDSLR